MFKKVYATAALGACLISLYATAAIAQSGVKYMVRSAGVVNLNGGGKANIVTSYGKAQNGAMVRKTQYNDSTDSFVVINPLIMEACASGFACMMGTLTFNGVANCTYRQWLEKNSSGVYFMTIEIRNPSGALIFTRKGSMQPGSLNVINPTAF